MKTLIIIIFMVLAILKTHAQDYLINFTGTGDTNIVSKVKVSNLRSGDTITLRGGDVLHLSTVVDIDEMKSNNKALQIYPNPMAEQAILTFKVPESSNTVIRIFDLSGRTVYQITTLLSPGSHSFRISGISPGVFFIEVRGKSYNYSTKLISQSRLQFKAKIEEIFSVNNPSRNPLKNSAVTIDMVYTEGDRLLFKGISGIYSTFISDIPNSSKSITFRFVKCTDADGNHYATVKIGDQTWMAENLKTTKLNNLTNIPRFADNSGWSQATFLCYCWYSNNEALYKNMYGALYNWHAAAESGGSGIGSIAPFGWHVPSYSEWATLTSNLGGKRDGGGKLKETGYLHWQSPNTGATNEYGFSALPSGFRYVNGSYYDVGLSCWWWSSGEYDSSTGYDFMINFDSPDLICNSAIDKRFGNSVRCIKEEHIQRPAVTTTIASQITFTSAVIGGDVLYDGGAVITGRGLVWSTIQYPTLESNNGLTYEGTGIGEFSSNLSNLSPDTKYYIRAFATNSAGTNYGNQISITTLKVLPTLTTTLATNVTTTSAISGGLISIEGVSVITTRGVCWSTSENPTIADSKTSDGTGSGSFTSSIAGLLRGTTYYIKAYATNSAGTNYGNQVTITTIELTTTIATAITSTTAVSGGNIAFDGGAAITARGVCWNTTGKPTTSDSKTSDGTGTGSFISNLTGLTACTDYYIRAYCTNSSGTFYSDGQIPFKTIGCSENISVTSFTTNNTIFKRGQTIDGQETIHATKGITSCYVGLYLSQDNQWNPNTDMLLKETKTTFILGSATIVQSYTFPSTTPLGTFYIICVADNNQVVNETDETDNVKYVKITVQ